MAPHQQLQLLAPLGWMGEPSKERRNEKINGGMEGWMEEGIK